MDGIDAADVDLRHPGSTTLSPPSMKAGRPGTIDASDDAAVVTDGGRRTDQPYWDEYWDDISLPAEATRLQGDDHGNSILDVLDRHLPRVAGHTAAEIGGAPGQYLAYVAKTFGYAVTCIDYSETGCRKTRENFRLLGIAGHVIEADVFADLADLPTFDVVYSLGLIEHFTERVSIVDRHVRLVNPGGFLVLGVPNLRGVQGWFFRRLAPATYAGHVIEAMDLAGWSAFEREFRLETVFKGYIGGFEPRIFCRIELRSPRTLLLFAMARVLNRLVHGPLGFLRRINGPRASGYAMAVYRVPGSVDREANPALRHASRA